MYILVTTMVIGVVQLIKCLFDKDYRSAITIVAAALVGGLAGAFNVEGMPDIPTGIVIGLAASGIVTVAQKVNSPTTPVR